MLISIDFPAYEHPSVEGIEVLSIPRTDEAVIWNHKYYYVREVVHSFDDGTIRIKLRW